MKLQHKRMIISGISVLACSWNFELYINFLRNWWYDKCLILSKDTLCAFWKKKSNKHSNSQCGINKINMIWRILCLIQCKVVNRKAKTWKTRCSVPITIRQITLLGKVLEKLKSMYSTSQRGNLFKWNKSKLPW